MNISCDKWGSRKSWSIVEGTFACQQTAVTPPGVWRQRNTRGGSVSPEDWCPVRTFWQCARWWQTHPQSIIPPPWVLKYILNWLGSIQTESGFFSSPFDSRVFRPRPQRPSDGTILIPVIFARTEVICLLSLMMEPSGSCLSDRFWAPNSSRLLETRGIGSCKQKWSL